MGAQLASCQACVPDNDHTLPNNNLDNSPALKYPPPPVGSASSGIASKAEVAPTGSDDKSLSHAGTQSAGDEALTTRLQEPPMLALEDDRRALPDASQHELAVQPLSLSGGILGSPGGAGDRESGYETGRTYVRPPSASDPTLPAALVAYQQGVQVAAMPGTRDQATTPVSSEVFQKRSFRDQGVQANASDVGDGYVSPPLQSDITVGHPRVAPLAASSHHGSGLSTPPRGSASEHSRMTYQSYAHRDTYGTAQDIGPDYETMEVIQRIEAAGVEPRKLAGNSSEVAAWAWSVLDLPRGSTGEIQSQFQKISSVVHPNKEVGNGEWKERAALAFQRLMRAEEILRKLPQEQDKSLRIDSRSGSGVLSAAVKSDREQRDDASSIAAPVFGSRVMSTDRKSDRDQRDDASSIAPPVLDTKDYMESKLKAKEWQFQIKMELRNVDRDIKKIQAEESKMQKKMTTMAANGDKTGVEQLARSIVRSRKAVERLEQTKGSMHAVNMQLTSAIATMTMKNSLQLSTQVVREMNGILRGGEVVSVMEDMRREQARCAQIDEEVADFFHDEELEQEAEADVRRILEEVELDRVNLLKSSGGRVAAPPSFSVGSLAGSSSEMSRRPCDGIHMVD